MSQSIFDAHVFGLYCSRHRYDSFEDFWRSKSLNPDGSEVRLVELLFAKASNYPRDENLKTELSQACLEIEKYWINKYGTSIEALSIFSSIQLQSETELAKVNMLVSDAKALHQNLDPEIRVKTCLYNLRHYEGQISTLKAPSFDDDTKIHYFLSEINEVLTSSYKYSGSVLKVLEQDSYLQSEDITWGRWTLYRDTTGYTDTWIVKIENGRPEVIKAVVRLDSDVYVIDDVSKQIQLDPEIIRAIDKTQVTAFDNSEFNTMPPPYLQMINMMNILVG